MGPETQRVNVAIQNKFLEAQSLVDYLAHYGVDVKLVSKHAVQVRPDHQQKAEELLKDFKWGWKNKQ